MVVEKVFAVIAESTRRDLLEALAQECKSVGQLVDELGVSQPTVSKHLRVLREAGVVTMRAQGQKRFYGINTEPLALVATWLQSLGAGVLVPAAVQDTNPAQKAPEKLAVSKTAEAATPRSVAAVPVSAAQSHEAPAVSVSATKAPAASSQPEAVPAPVATTVSAAPPAPHPVPAAPTAAAAAAKVEAAPAKAGPVKAVPAPANTPATPGKSAAVSPAVIVQSNENEGSRPAQLGRSVGRAANKAADLLANLPSFRRRKD